MTAGSQPLQFVTNQRKRFELCPQCPCGKSNKDGKFAPLVDNPTAGKCHSCDKFFTGSEGTIHPPPILPPSKPLKAAYIPFKYVERAKGFNSGLHDYAHRLFRQYYKPTFDLYHIGGTRAGDTVYWQINIDRDVCRCMIKHQVPETGKGGKPCYIHKKILAEANIKGDSPYCAFGEHLLANNGKVVAVVESQKTAVLMAVYDRFHKPPVPRIWIATCGSSNLKKLIDSKVLDGRQVVLVPDANKAEEWEKVSLQAGKAWKVSKWLKGKYRDGNIDILDTLLTDKSFEVVLHKNGYPLIWKD